MSIKKVILVTISFVFLFSYFVPLKAYSTLNSGIRVYNMERGIHSKEIKLQSKEIAQTINSVEMKNISNNISTWAKVFGGTKGDEAFSVLQTSDGGILITGITASFGEGNGLLVIKLSSGGSLLWAKAFSDVADYGRSSAVETSSGQIAIVAAYSKSGSGDFLFLKLDSNGNILTQKSYGGDGEDLVTQIIQTSDGGFVIGGNTNSFSEGSSALILKIDSDSNVKWIINLPEVDRDSPVYLCETGDKGIAVACSTTTIGAGDFDILVFKLNSGGSLVWSKTLGGEYEDRASAVVKAGSTDFVVAGYTSSFGAGNDDCIAVRFNSSGSVVWASTYGTGYNEEFYGAAATSDGGFACAGETLGFDAKSDDLFLVKIDANGSVKWAKTFKGAEDDWADAVTESSDSGFIVVGHTRSFTSFDSENADFLVVKTDSSGNISGSCDYINSCSPDTMKISNIKVNAASIKGVTVSVTTDKSSSAASNSSVLSATVCGSSQIIIILQINNPKMKVNGVEKPIDEQGTKPIIKNNRTLVPIRAIIESLGGMVSWNGTDRKVTLTLGSTTMELWIGNPIAKVNGTDTKIDVNDPKVVPEIINSRTMLPLRFVSENLGCEVLWTSETQTITIKYPKS